MTFKRFVLFASLAFSVASTSFSADTLQVQAVGPFGGLNTNTSQEAISATQSPDLLNVDISNEGTSVKKRQGYGVDATLTISTSAVHNLYKFFDSSGNEIRLAFNDNRVSSSVNGASWSVILTTGTVGAIWDCTDYLGYAYCVSSSFDNPIKTNGTTAGTTGVGGTNAVPAGTLISNSGDRLLVGGTATNPSRISYSQSTVFTNFTLGTQSSDSSFEDILAPGSKLTHLAYRFGRWLWWKDQSFGFLIGTGQFDLQLVIVSNTIGTLDNTDVFDGSYCYFRGSDAQIYTYDGSTLSRTISTDIAPTLRLANRRKANNWTQNSQTDFASGSIVPTTHLSTSLSPGNVIVSSFAANEYSSTQWTSGSAINLTVGTSSIALTTNNLGNMTNNDFESALAGNWGCSFGTGSATCGVKSTGVSGDCGTVNPQNGSNLLLFSEVPSAGPGTWSFEALDVNTLVILSSVTISFPTCAWAQGGLTPPPAYVGRRVKFRIHDAVPAIVEMYTTTTDSYIWGGPVSYYVNSNVKAGIAWQFEFDNIQSGSSTITSGSFTSKVYDTTFTSATYSLSNFQWTANTSAPTFALLTSTAPSNATWLATLTSSGTNAVGNRYARYVSTISVNGTDSALTYISSAAVIAVATGTYYSAVNSALNLTSFNTIGITDNTNGNSAITYYSRTSTNSFTVLSTTPTWIAQTKNATVSASSGTFMQLRADFSVTAATETPTLGDFTFNWFEGTASDKMYGTYFNNAIWFSLSLGTSTTTNNRIFRYDMLSNVWTLYDVTANGFLTYNNNLYFGDPTAGRIFQFGNNVYADNGTAIQAYWKSKPFFGDSPFTDKDLRTASWFVSYASGTTLSLTYTLSQSTNTITKSINLYDARRGVIQNNWNFPSGTNATTFSAKFGDTSTNPSWEVFGGLITFISKPWIASP